MDTGSCAAVSTPRRARQQGPARLREEHGERAPGTLLLRLRKSAEQLPDPTERHIMAYASLTHCGNASSPAPISQEMEDPTR